MSTINVDFKIGRLDNLGYTLVTIFMISVGVILVRIMAINTSVRLVDFARFEILYGMIGAFLGLFLSQVLIKQHKKGRQKTYGSRSTRR